MATQIPTAYRSASLGFSAAIVVRQTTNVVPNRELVRTASTAVKGESAKSTASMSARKAA